MSTGDATPDDDLRPGALPIEADRCVRVTLRVPKPTMRVIDRLVENDVFVDHSSALRAGAYEIVKEHDDEVRR